MHAIYNYHFYCLCNNCFQKFEIYKDHYFEIIILASVLATLSLAVMENNYLIFILNCISDKIWHNENEKKKVVIYLTSMLFSHENFKHLDANKKGSMETH